MNLTDSRSLEIAGAVTVAGGTDYTDAIGHCETVRSITLSVPDDTYRQARIRAARLDTSVSAMVASYLRSIGDVDERFVRLAELQRRTTAGIQGFRADDRLDRETVHDRAVR